MKKENNKTISKQEGKEMIHIKYLLIFLFSSIFLLSFAKAQETIPITGGNANGSGGSVSYTYGQTFFMTNTGSNGSVAEGVQQPFEISVVIGIKENDGITLNCSAFPNPTEGDLTLNIPDINTPGLLPFTFNLFDINGNLIETQNIESNISTIHMKNLVPGTYFLKVNQSKQEIKIFKIIKL